MPITKFVTSPASSTPMEPPAEGFPFAEHELRVWFLNKHGREATELEIGAIMATMTARENGQVPSSEELWGWSVEPVAPRDR